jgi:outer membrane protein OmpA-like peptidoglycan-associated protein
MGFQRVTRRSLGSAHSMVPNALRSPGRPLDPVVLERMAAHFRHDFSTVRVHDDAADNASAEAVGARAYTVGQHIVFGPGAYQPVTEVGARLLAHELAHTIQQADARPVNPWLLPVDRPDSPAEAQADRVADTLRAGAAGGSPPIVDQRSAYPRVQRVIRPDKLQGTPPEASYSTNCGWIDWGHARPDMAKRLIQDMRAASARLHAAEGVQARELGHHVVAADEPGMGVYEDCPKDHEAGERVASAQPQDPLSERLAFANHEEIYLYGFEVGKADASRFAGIIGAIGAQMEKDESLQAEIYGFSDCLGPESMNRTLRAERALAVQQLLPESVHSRVPVTIFADTSRYLDSNLTPEGRRRNRAVAIKLLRPLPSESVSAMERAGAKGVSVNFASVTAEILRPLTVDEELRVALAIFMAVSTIFEDIQRSTDPIVRSSFSEEDLPSNLIGFYVEARGLNFRPDVEAICDAWDATRSLNQLRGYTFSSNPTFKPLRLPPGGAWPTQFDDIQPEPPGRLFRISSITTGMPGPGGVQHRP